MAKMRIYTVHIDPQKKNPYENPVFIEEAFNWWAFIFRGFWFLYHRLWLWGVGLIAFEIVMQVLIFKGHIPTAQYLVFRLGIQILLGYHGNDFRRARLKRQGYITSDIVTSDNLVGAEQRFYERYFTHYRVPFSPAHSSTRPVA